MNYAGLRGANLHDASLTGANLHKAELDGAGLSEAGMTKANLTGASLNCVALDGAILRGADLTKGDPTGGADTEEIRVDLRSGLPVIGQRIVWFMRFYPFFTYDGGYGWGEHCRSLRAGAELKHKRKQRAIWQLKHPLGQVKARAAYTARLRYRPRTPPPECRRRSSWPNNSRETRLRAWKRYSGNARGLLWRNRPSSVSSAAQEP
jgi:hypothetical protein